MMHSHNEADMTLKEWFDSQPHGSKAIMARRLGITRTWMSGIISGRETCSPYLAVAISQMTNGAVRKEDLRPDLFGSAS